MQDDTAKEIIENAKKKFYAVLNELNIDEETLVKRAKLNLKTCPVNSNHRIVPHAFDAHVAKCRLRSKGINPDKVISLPSASTAYQNSTTVIPLAPALDHIPKVEEEPEYDVYQFYFPQPEHYQNYSIMNGQYVHNDVISEDDEYNVLDTSIELPNVLYPKLQTIISSWRKIPGKFRFLELHILDRNRIVDWFHRNLYKYSRPADTNEVYNYLYSVLMQNMDNPNNIVKLVYPQLGEKSTNFVIDIWKFLALDILNKKHKYFVEIGAVKEAPKVQSNEPITNVVSKSHDVMKRSDKRDQYLHDTYVAEKMRSTLPPSKSLEIDSVESKPSQSEQSKSDIEKLQEMRDYKRRRQTYRAKNVHITKKTPTAIARDMINMRMEELGVDLDGNEVKDELPPPPPVEEKRNYPPPPPMDNRKRYHDDRHYEDRRYDRRDDRRDRHR